LNWLTSWIQTDSALLLYPKSAICFILIVAIACTIKTNELIEDHTDTDPAPWRIVAFALSTLGVSAVTANFSLFVTILITLLALIGYILTNRKRYYWEDLW
jgi:hypothetical protein